MTKNSTKERIAELIPCSFIVDDGERFKKTVMPYDHCLKIAYALISAGLCFKDEIGIDELKTHLLLDKLDDFMKFPGNLYRAKYIHDHIKDLLTFEKEDKR